MRLGAERVAERRVDQVRGGVRLRSGVAVHGIHHGRRGVVHRDLAGAHLHGVADEALDGLLHVEHLEVEAVADDRALVGRLATRLRVERRLGEDHLGDLARARLQHRLAADQDAEDARLGLQILVAGEDGLALGPEPGIHREVRDLALLGLRVRLSPLALLLHEGVECRAVDGEARLLGDLQRQVDGEPEGVVQQERGVAGQRLAARLLGLGDGRVENRGAAREGAQERLLLAEGKTRGALPVLGHIRVGRRHGVARGGKQLGEAGRVDTQQAHGAHHPPHQATQDVSASLVAGRDAVGHQHETRPHVVGDDAHPHIVVVVRAVAASGQLGRAVEHRAHLVDLVHVVDALLEEGDALHAHAGVDVLLRQLAEHREVDLARHVGEQVLHEHEVPDLDVPRVVDGGAALRPERGSSVEVDLRAGSSGAGLAGVPVVVGAAEALDALRGQAGDALPERGSLIVVLVDRDPEVLLREAEPAIRLRAGQQLPGIGDRLLLEVVAEGEVAVHLEERAVTGGLADLLDIERANALLHARGARERRRNHPGEVRDERNHARDREQERRVVADERGRGHDRVVALSEEGQPTALNFSGLHEVILTGTAVPG